MMTSEQDNQKAQLADEMAKALREIIRRHGFSFSVVGSNLLSRYDALTAQELDK